MLLHLTGSASVMPSLLSPWPGVGMGYPSGKAVSTGARDVTLGGGE